MLSDQWNHEPEAVQAEPGNYYWSMVLPVVTGALETTAKMRERGILGDGQEACLLAAANGQLSIVQYLHQGGCDLARIAHRVLPLAAANGRLDVVKYLHTSGCDIRVGDDAALKAAAAKNRLPVLKYLHEQGADLSACRDIARLLLLSPENKPTIDYLATNGINPAEPRLLALLEAIRTGDLLLAKKRIKYLDVPVNSDLIAPVAAELGELSVMVFLHQNGCDIRVENALALRIAAQNGHAHIVEYLHNNGADLHANDEDAVKLAAENGHHRTVKLLCERGANIRKIGEDTLELIQLYGHTTVYNYLTECGLDAINRHRPAIAAMRKELYAAKPVYRPSKLWEHFNDVNMEQLGRGGMNQFKRSVNQNYFNFIPYSLFDPQLLRLIKWWAVHPTLTPFMLKVNDPDIVPEEGRLLPIDRRVFTLGQRNPVLSWITRNLRMDLGRSAQKRVYRWLVAMLWDYTAAHDKLGLVEKLAEPRLGSPVEIYYQAKLVSQDLAHSILECNSILGEIGELAQDRSLRIAEVGAGYGRLGYVLLHAVKCQYVVFDIPPSLYVSQWYLSEVFPVKRIFRFRNFERFDEIVGELAEADIAFFTANQIELFPAGYFDMSINISSLHELRPDQIDNMLGQIYRITRRYVYLKQYREYVNPYDSLVIREDSYKVAPGWKKLYHRSDTVDSRFFEALIEADSPPTTGEQAGPTELSSAASHLTRSVSEPTVSVLLANYNHAEYLPTSLAGICGQTKPATEIIIVDDGSTDDSVAVIEEYSLRFPNIRLIRNDRNRGQSYSIQRALLAARSDYVVWAAADDLLLPHFIERSLGVLKSYPEAGLCFSRLAVFVDGTSEVRHFTERSHGVAFDYGQAPRFISPAQLGALLRGHYLWMSGNTVIARRSAVLEMGGFEKSLRWHSDWFAFYVVALRYGACVIPETLALMRERRDTYSRGGIGNPREQDKVLEAIFHKIKSPKYRDLLPIFRRCPSLLSPFGRRAFFVAAHNMRHWNFVYPLARWYAPRLVLRIYGRLRRWLAVRRNWLKGASPGKGRR